MTLIIHKTYGYSFNGFKVFWINRILRLYPVNIVIILLTLILVLCFPEVQRNSSIYFTSSLMDWLFNVTMVYPEIVPHRFSPRIGPTSWAITNELVFYLLIALGLSKTFKRTLFWFAISVLYYVLTYKFYNLATFRYSAIPAASLPFSIGALIFWFFEKNKFKNDFSYIRLILYLTFFYLNGVFGDILGDFSIYINMSFGALIIIQLFRVKNFKFFKIDKYIGLYSYPVYLSHYLVLIVYTAFFSFGLIENSLKLHIYAIPLYLILLILFNFLIVEFIDIKVDKIKKKIKANKL
jgi:peptidoglycan/LPS O-acetylase OafA/YrhL